MEEKNSLDLDRIKRQFLEEFRSGKPTFYLRQGGALAPILKHFLEAEMDVHLDPEERQRGNRRNGKVTMQVRISDRVVEVESSRDRSSGFEPQIIKKRETVLAQNLEPRILSMYGLGMSLGAFPSDMALLKLIYLAHQNISRKWVMPLSNWSQTAQQLSIWFGDRMQLDLK